MVRTLVIDDDSENPEAFVLRMLVDGEEQKRIPLDALDRLVLTAWLRTLKGRA